MIGTGIMVEKKTINKTIERFVRYIVAILGIYEAVAIVTQRVPTLSRICWEARKHRLFRFLLWLFVGFLVDHLLNVPPTPMGK